MKGLTPSWNYGTIYASKISKTLITDRYPNLKDLVIDLEMDQEHWIYCDEAKKEGVSVMLMDACHCPGAVMLLFRGKMGTVLHTGDFRFSASMFENPILFPREMRNERETGISIEVDTLMLDNTFADPTVDFPSREEAYGKLKKIVGEHKEFRIFVFSYFLGKEEVFLKLAEDFETLIVVDEDRYRKLCLMDLKPELFTTDPDLGRIHIKAIKSLSSMCIEEANKEEPTIFVPLTGWNNKYNSNLPYYFKVPYSSHSNPKELERFVRAIQPRNIVFTVPNRESSRTRQEFQRYLINEYVEKPHNLTSLHTLSRSMKST